MNDLLGYLLNLDEAGDRRRVEERLRGDPAAARELAALERVLAPLAADRDSPTLPPDLAARTIAFVAGHGSHHSPLPERGANGRPTPAKLRQLISVLDRTEVAPSRWRRADFIVLASVVLLALSISLASLPYLRHRHNLQACQNHLRQLYQSLESYADTHAGGFPKIREEPPYDNAAAFVPMLQEAGTLPATQTPACPAAGPGNFISYAYTLGYQNEEGQLMGLRHEAGHPGLDLLPIVADRPSPNRIAPNPDHRSGQNVLFVGGNVRFCTTTAVGINEDEIYVNTFNRARRGTSIVDSVLGAPGDRP